MQWIMHRQRSLAAVFLLLLLLSQIPARLLTWVLPPSVTLTGLTGTLWSGDAARGWVIVEGKPLLLGRVSWQIQPWRALWSTPVMLQSEWSNQQLQTRVGLGLTGDWLLTDTRLQFDTRMLGQFFPLYLGGTVSGQFATLEFSKNHVARAQGVIKVQDAVWTARSGNIPLGTYRLTVSPLSDAAGAISAALLTEQGALQLEGDVTVSPQSYEVALRATGPTARDESFRRAVAMLATPTAEGFDVLVQGQL